jgi:hypothetical protein
MLDTQKMAEMVKGDGRQGDPKAALTHDQIAPLLVFHDDRSSPPNLVDLGLQAVGQWLRDLMR